MRKKLPGIFETLKRAVQLCIKSYLSMLPFVMLQMGLSFFTPDFDALMQYIVPSEATVSTPPVDWLHIGLYGLVQTLLSAGTLLNIYMFSQGQHLSFVETGHTVVKRFISIFSAYLISGLPLMFTSLFMTMAIYNHALPSGWVLLGWGSVLVAFSTYGIFSHLMAVVGHARGWLALNDSWLLVSGYWLDTFLIFTAGFACFAVLGTFLSDNLFSQAFTALIAGPSLAALFVVHYKHLLEAKW